MELVNVRDSIIKIAKEISGNKNFDFAIAMHAEFISEIDSGYRPILRKLFKYSQFDIFDKLMCMYFSEEEPTLLKLKESVIKDGLICLNSLISFVKYLEYAKLVTLRKSDKDKRGLIFEPTSKCIELMRELLLALAIPYNYLNNGEHVEIDLFEYYKRHSYILKVVDGIGLFDPGIKFFLSRDSGYSIILNIYSESLMTDGSLSSVSKNRIAKSNSISRTHMNSILSNAISSGLILRSGNKLILTEEFKCMCKRHFSLRMAMVSYGLGI